jgi:hypothetical protein
MTTRIAVQTVAAVSAFLTLISCSDVSTAPPAPASGSAGANAAKEAPKPPEPGTAKTAYWKMYKPIREWSKDALPLNMASKEIPEMKGTGDGKEAAWAAVFVSPSLRQARVVTYSEVDSGKDIRKGVNIAATMPWGGATRTDQPFPNGEFGIDSDAAYKTAAAKAAPWLKTHPNMKLNMHIAKSADYATAVWVVNWGDKTNGFLALVNAANGDLISPK